MPLNAPPVIYGQSELTDWLLSVYHYLGSLPSTNIPSSSTDYGTKGQLAYDNTYLYICYDTNSWARLAYTDVVF